MPEYKFFNKTTSEEWLEWMSISECDQFLKDNPHIEQLVHGYPKFTSDPMRVGGTNVSKPDNGFTDILKEVKKKHPLGDGIKIR